MRTGRGEGRKGRGGTSVGIIRAYNPPWWKQFSRETEYNVKYVYRCI